MGVALCKIGVIKIKLAQKLIFLECLIVVLKDLDSKWLWTCLTSNVGIHNSDTIPDKFSICLLKVTSNYSNFYVQAIFNLLKMLNSWFFSSSWVGLDSNRAHCLKEKRYDYSTHTLQYRIPAVTTIPANSILSNCKLDFVFIGWLSAFMQTIALSSIIYVKLNYTGRFVN